MRAAAASAMAVLLLVGCGTAEEPDETPSASATETVSATGEPAEVDLAGICEAMGAAWLALADGAVEYVVAVNPPPAQGFSTNASLCDIEPEGEYYDVAAEAGAFGRAEFDYAPYVPEQYRGQPFPEYDPQAVEQLLTLDQADPLRDELPCLDEPCSDGIHGYQYNFRFETVMADFVVVAQLDFIATDTSGERQDAYRDQAVAMFTACMEALAAEVG